MRRAPSAGVDLGLLQLFAIYLNCYLWKYLHSSYIRVGPFLSNRNLLTPHLPPLTLRTSPTIPDCNTVPVNAPDAEGATATDTALMMVLRNQVRYC